MLRKILLIGVILTALGGGYGYYMWNKKPATMDSRTADITLTANDLAVQFDKDKHGGKVIAVKGKVTAVETIEGTTNITIETDDPLVSISCEMEKGAEPPSVKEGEEVTLKGQCDGKLEMADVQLSRCIIVK
jgi:RecJ-like exonuclease